MDDKHHMLRHFPAALAYRTQKAVRGAPDDFFHFRAAPGVRTPHQVIFHMTNVMGYARTFFVGGEFDEPILEAHTAEVDRFHGMLQSLRKHLEGGSPLRGTTPENMLQGPFSDAMLHAGQLALLRRLYGSPVPPENFIVATISHENLGTDQPAPESPDEEWFDAEGRRQHGQG